MNSAQLATILATVIPQIDPQARHDANETLAFARGLEYVYSQTYDVKYPELMARQILPVDYSVPNGAKQHTYRQFDMEGEAAIVDDSANDFPNVEGSGLEFTGKVVSIGDSYRYSINDLRQAQMLGLNLDTMKAQIARKIMERKLDQLACLGDTATGLLGIARHTSIGSIGGQTGTWSNATAEQIQADIDNMLVKVNNDTKGAQEANTLVLPVGLYNTLRVKYFTAGGFRRSVMEEIQTRNSQLRILKWSRLETANGSNGRRVIVGQFDPETCAMIVPQEFEQLPPQPKAMSLVVSCHMRFGGVTVRYPKAFIYQDNA